ncbi:MAG TPA: HAD-IIIA family hydrolase [Steroidobacteraceae bacterium]|nr:HAD-IIIA family hydrolase [Steroidobacteraceae bacterium]
MAAARANAPRRAARAPASQRRGVPLESIRLLVLDVDGVLTDGRLRYGPYGERDKVFHVRDGHGIKAIRAAGIDVGVISGRRSPAVQRRCRELGIEHLLQGIEDKGAAFVRLIEKLGVPARQCACIGDDVPDLPIMQQAGLAVAVADAHPTALAASHRRTRALGGFGAVREVCDWLLAARRAP